MSQPAKVFVSYSRRQKNWVDLFVEQWRALGLKVFIDEQSIITGEYFAETIAAELRKCRNVVLMLTPEALESRWVTGELRLITAKCITGEQRLFPVLLEPVNRDAAPDLIKDKQWVDLTNAETQSRTYHKFLRELGVKRRDLPDPPPRPLSKTFHLNRSRKVLAIGSHWDDILLGCFGTLLKLKLLYNYQVVLIVLCTHYHGKYYGVPQDNLEATARHIYEAIKQRFDFHYEFIPNKTVIEDRQFRDKSKELHEVMEEFATKYADSSLIFTPPSDDRHEDHSFTGQLIFSNFRQTYQTILEYEIKKYTDRWFVPNLFVSLDEEAPGGAPGQCVADLKTAFLSELIVGGERTKVDGSEFLFGLEPLKARLIVNALDHGGNKLIKYGEVFRGRISI